MSFCKKKIKKKYKISKVLVPVPDVYYMFIKCIFVRVHQVRSVNVLFVCLSVCLLTTRLSHRYYQKTIFSRVLFSVVCFVCERRKGRNNHCIKKGKKKKPNQTNKVNVESFSFCLSF